MCVCAYPKQKTFYWCGVESIRPLRSTQLGRHGGRFIYIGQCLRAVLGLAIFCCFSLIAICVIVKVWRAGGTKEGAGRKRRDVSYHKIKNKSTVLHSAHYTPTNKLLVVWFVTSEPGWWKVYTTLHDISDAWAIFKKLWLRKEKIYGCTNVRTDRDYTIIGFVFRTSI